MLFAERNFEITLLRDLYSKSEQGKAQTVLVEAPVACGKTALLHTFADEAEESGALILTATGSRAEQSHPFGLISQLLHDQGLQPWVDPQVRTLLRQTPAPAPEGPDPVVMEQTTAQLARELCNALLELAAHKTVLIGVDDVQYADDPSLQILLFLLRRLRSERLLVIINDCKVSPPNHPTFRAELLRQPNCHRVELLPLTVAGITEVLTEYVDEATAAQLAPAYSEVSGGNPLLLGGLIEDGTLRQPGGGRALSAKPIAKEAFQQAVFACLYRWDQSTIEVARGLALLGAHSSPSLIGQVTGMKSARVEQIMGVLTRSRLQRDGQLRHPAVNAAVLNTLPLDDSARMHLHAARLLHDSGADPISVADHLIAAGTAPDQWAVAVLQDACTHALAEDQVEFATQCLELARYCCEDARLRASLTLSLARLKWRHDPSAVASHLTPLKEALVEGLLEERDAITVSRYLLWRSRLEDAQELLRQLEANTDASDPSIAADLGNLENFHHWLRREQPKPVREADGAPRATDHDVPHPDEFTASSALTSALSDGPHAKAIDWAESILASASLSDASIGVVQFGLSLLIHAGRTDKAASTCQAFLVEARARRATTWEAVLSAVLAETALRQGDFPTAERQAKEAIQLISGHGWGVAIGYPLSVQLLAQTAMSKHEEASRLVRRSDPKAAFQGLYGLKYLHARGHHYLATKRLQAARSDFRRCGDLVREWSLDLPALVPWRSDLARVQLGMDQSEAARELVVEQLSMPGADNPRTRGMTLRVLAAAKPLKQRPPLLREAISLLQDCGDRGELACALAELSHVHHELGEFNRARMMGHQAMQIARDCGTEQLCRLLLPTSETADGLDRPQTDGVETLSDAERRVAALAAMEHTNREIARQLYITTSTVEQHLTKVYRKLNVKRREDLP
ncbi:AAA family ATPase, partial [Streptomyces sp. NPDC048483]|uniref:AAA family ATPase n=1 Tax=Streptomyces sp. NPDC048483 TaxID=3154927 RepID=UPI003439FA22